MGDLTAQNVLKYVVTILAGALAAALGVLAVQLAGVDPVNWRPVIAAGIGPVVTGLAAMQLTRVGSEPIAAQVDSLQAAGTHKRDMVVVSQDEAVPLLAGALSPSQVAQVADEIEARLRQTPAGTAPASVPDRIIELIDQAETEGKG
jgi:hypothetical protein